MKKYLNSNDGNYIVSIAIGKDAKNNWIKYVKYNWLQYCKKNGIGLIMFFDELIEKDNDFWKKATWQKLLIGEKLSEHKINVNNVCYLDIDILINNELSPNIFEFHKNDYITVVSQRKRLNLNLQNTLKNIAFNRHYYYSKKYPLDSALFMSPKEIFEYHKFKLNKKILLLDEYFCAGLFIFNKRKYSKKFKNIFFKYKKDFKSITNGDEPILNYEFQKINKLNFIDYRFQCLWIYEMASKYPFLYDKKILNKNLLIRCLENSLFNNYFVHFAGSWGETNLWKIRNLHKIIFNSTRTRKLALYLNRKVSSKPVGRIIPKK